MDKLTATVTTVKWRRVFGITFSRSTTTNVEVDPRAIIDLTSDLLKSSAL